jgi:hypothetical protein
VEDESKDAQDVPSDNVAEGSVGKFSERSSHRCFRYIHGVYGV